jgi:hypothetical protein
LEDRPHNPTDILRWIDTVVMIADPLTKQMRADVLLQVLQSNLWNYGQPEYAKQDKCRKQWLRRKAKDRKQEDELQGIASYHEHADSDLEGSGLGSAARAVAVGAAVMYSALERSRLRKIGV